MAKLYGTNTTPRGQTPVGQMDGSAQGGNLRVYREVVNLAGQTTADTIVVAYPSKGEQFLYGVLTASASLGTSTISIGVAGATARYKTAGTFTATETPTLFGQGTLVVANSKLAADTEVFITIGTAALPASGTLIVDLVFAQT
jgi:hypothetical protein